MVVVFLHRIVMMMFSDWLKHSGDWQPRASCVVAPVVLACECCIEDAQ